LEFIYDSTETDGKGDFHRRNALALAVHAEFARLVVPNMPPVIGRTPLSGARSPAPRFLEIAFDCPCGLQYQHFDFLDPASIATTEVIFDEFSFMLGLEVFLFSHRAL
jgi:hypothetical protein